MPTTPAMDVLAPILFLLSLTNDPALLAELVDLLAERCGVEAEAS